MATAKAERLLNLVIALVNSPRFRTAQWIRDKVAGYGDAPSEEAFFRTFERDKAELREAGIPLQTPEDGSDGYRIPPGDLTLPQLSFTPAETAALALAGRLWETTALAAAGSAALRKIRDAAAAPGGPGTPAPGDPDSTTDPGQRAAGLLQPRVRTADPSFAPLYAAIRARRSVTFAYRKSLDGPAETRSVQPWGLVSYAGRWYLVGHDTGRDARRTFRLSRIAGPVQQTGRAGSVQVPPGLDLLAFVAGSAGRVDGARPAAQRPAVLRMRAGRAAGLRRSAVRTLPGPLPDGWDRVEITMDHLWDTARAVAAAGPDVVVESPADLRDAVVRLLTATLDTVRGAVPPDGPAADGEPAVVTPVLTALDGTGTDG
ncbi:helix-turn-helix transcriptional regulator [Nakamurella endophytica]|uniref:WYL domain-containing protein n=1 Tax=Nakamurella endophytica TaxID=1748367 RepID=A0A917WC03_9ACTN|nr:WYL domain-containing protein [Nakamurella endophytica]GGL91296.1 WYL domain-containing protein [Nakamurella endophytica]